MRNNRWSRHSYRQSPKRSPLGPWAAQLMKWATWKRLPAAPDLIPGATVRQYLVPITPDGTGQTESLVGGRYGMLLVLPRAGYQGLWFKVARGGNLPDGTATAWQERLRLAGYRAEIVQGEDEAKALVLEYVSGGAHG